MPLRMVWRATNVVRADLAAEDSVHLNHLDGIGELALGWIIRGVVKGIDSSERAGEVGCQNNAQLNALSYPEN